ncbi:MAG: hypothetical protein HEP71_29735 [Roseivirga sp.]|nr:hypothetical protein [Roseivirga sp.]
MGIIHFEDTFSQRLQFYSNPDTLTEPVFHVDIHYEDTVKSIRTSLIAESDTLEFYPLYMRSHSSLLILQVMEQRGNWYRVCTDDIYKITHWVYLEGEVLESWREFLPTVSTVSPAVRTNRLRRNPTDKAQEYNVNTEMLCLRVVHVNGDWLKVRNDPDYCSAKFIIEEEFEGFLRWREGEDVLIFFTP